MSKEKKPTPPSVGGGSSPAAKVNQGCPLCAGDDSVTSGNRIDIAFDPDNSSKVKKCEKIVHVQYIRMLVDDVVAKPGDYYSGYKYRDPVTTDDGWYVDHLQTEKTPDYQQGMGDGKKNGDSAKATISDAPNTGGGDKGFYNLSANPKGWKRVNYEFSSFAYCMKGDDCGKWYEGVQWEYTKTWEDARDGKKGESKIIDKNVTSEPSKSQLEAFEKFNKAKGFTPCK